MTEARAYMRHLRRFKICSKGAREWWAAHGLDWADHVKNGTPVSVLRKIGGAHVDRVTAAAEEEHGQKQ